jgi:hypothetical protein
MPERCAILEKDDARADPTAHSGKADTTGRDEQEYAQMLRRGRLTVAAPVSERVHIWSACRRATAAAQTREYSEFGFARPNASRMVRGSRAVNSTRMT